MPRVLLTVFVSFWLGSACLAQSPATTTTHDFVDVAKTIPGIVVDSPYATSANFLKRRLYPANKCYLRKTVAERLAKVQAELQTRGLGLKVWDGYRPLEVQQAMWKILPDSRYVANPEKGSRHNRGAAVDITLVDAQGTELVMPTKFDDFSTAAHVGSKKASPEAAKNSALLQEVMKRHGFLSLATEWWHFDAPDWKSFPVDNVAFDQIESTTSPPDK